MAGDLSGGGDPRETRAFDQSSVFDSIQTQIMYDRHEQRVVGSKRNRHAEIEGSSDDESESNGCESNCCESNCCE